MYDTTSHGGPTGRTSATILPLFSPSQTRQTSSEVQSNVLFWGTLPLSQRQMQLLFGFPSNPYHVCHEMLYYTCPSSQLSSANYASSKARHSYRAPPENSEPSLSSAGSMSAALPPWCASHRGPDPQRLIQRSGLGIQEWTFY